MYPINQQGSNGCDFIAAGESATFNGMGFTVLQDAVLTSITMPKGSNTGNVVGPTIAAGITVFGTITQLTVTSGIIQYFAESQQDDSRD